MVIGIGRAKALVLLFTLGLNLPTGWAAPLPQKGDTVVTYRFAEVARMAELYRRLAGPEAIVLADPLRRRLIVRDDQDRQARLLPLLATLDRPDGQHFHVYVRPVVHRTAEELARLLQPMAAALGSCPVLIGDSQGDRLLVVALPETYRRLDRLARRLDVPAAHGQTIWVRPAP